jgi:hypothetical protein
MFAVIQGEGRVEAEVTFTFEKAAIADVALVWLVRANPA